MWWGPVPGESVLHVVFRCRSRGGKLLESSHEANTKLPLSGTFPFGQLAWCSGEGLGKDEGLYGRVSLALPLAWDAWNG